MSDFIFSSEHKSNGELKKHIQSIYHSDKLKVTEYHGSWGSVAVSKNLYNGLQPLETKTHIFIVIGGPVLYFRDNYFLTRDDPVEGSASIFDRYKNNKIQWDEDLSGPFVILIIDKKNGKIQCVTDLMMFIPVYQYHQNETLMLSTHVDVLAKASGQENNIDTVSVADFILNDVITYPYTTYQNIFQIHPASIHSFNPKDNDLKSADIHSYWFPIERNEYTSINQAAIDLRQGVQEFIQRVVENMDEVAHFLSAGEDSRVIAGLLPSKLKRHAFIFLDSMNKEGIIAKQVAEKYETDFHVEFRDENHYLHMLPEASELIGSGQQYVHAHSLKLDKKCKLDYYPAVFGGYSSDTLLKGYFAPKKTILNYFPFLPEIFNANLKNHRSIKYEFISNDIINEINLRRKKHVRYVKKFRKFSAYEWFMFWPASMRPALPNLHSNRRLFRTYEPFMSKDVVKISASVPTTWKLNRRLFNKAMRPFLKDSKSIIHPKGFLPYYPWWFNIPIRFIFWIWSNIIRILGLNKNHQGPWADWKKIMQNKEWKLLVNKYTSRENYIDNIFTLSPKKLLTGNDLTILQKINLLQALYETNKRKQK